MDDDIEVASTTESQNDEVGERYMEFYTDSPPTTTNDEEVSIPHEEGPVTGDQYAKTLRKNDKKKSKNRRGDTYVSVTGKILRPGTYYDCNNEEPSESKVEFLEEEIEPEPAKSKCSRGSIATLLGTNVFTNLVTFTTMYLYFTYENTQIGSINQTCIEDVEPFPIPNMTTVKTTLISSNVTTAIDSLTTISDPTTPVPTTTSTSAPFSPDTTNLIKCEDDMNTGPKDYKFAIGGVQYEVHEVKETWYYHYYKCHSKNMTLVKRGTEGLKLDKGTGVIRRALTKMTYWTSDIEDIEKESTCWYFMFFEPNDPQSSFVPMKQYCREKNATNDKGVPSMHFGICRADCS